MINSEDLKAISVTMPFSNYFQVPVAACIFVAVNICFFLLLLQFFGLSNKQ